MKDEPFARDTVQRLCTIIGMLMEDSVECALTHPRTETVAAWEVRLDALRQAGVDIAAMAAAAEVVLRRYG